MDCVCIYIKKKSSMKWGTKHVFFHKFIGQKRWIVHRKGEQLTRLHNDFFTYFFCATYWRQLIRITEITVDIYMCKIRNITVNMFPNLNNFLPIICWEKYFSVSISGSWSIFTAILRQQINQIWKKKAFGGYVRTEKTKKKREKLSPLNLWSFLLTLKLWCLCI